MAAPSWWRDPETSAAHALMARRPITTLCGRRKPPGSALVLAPVTGQCQSCYNLSLNELTSAAALANVALNLDWVDTESQARRVCNYIASELSNLRTEIENSNRRMVARLDAIYKEQT